MNLKKWIGSTFGSAYLIYFSPGTSSSLIVFIALWCAREYINFTILISLILISIILGTFSIKGFKETDPKDFTLDETFAIFIISFFSLENYLYHICGFAIFRFFDILKPLGIKYIENKTKEKRLFSIYVDDFIAALYTILSLKILNYAKFI